MPYLLKSFVGALDFVHVEREDLVFFLFQKAICNYFLSLQAEDKADQLQFYC